MDIAWKDSFFSTADGGLQRHNTLVIDLPPSEWALSANVPDSTSISADTGPKPDPVTRPPKCPHTDGDTQPHRASLEICSPKSALQNGLPEPPFEQPIQSSTTPLSCGCPSCVSSSRSHHTMTTPGTATMIENRKNAGQPMLTDNTPESGLT